MADFRKSANGGGGFLQAHVGNCPVADFGKSANWGGISAITCRYLSSGRFQKICKLGGNFCKHTSANVQWQILENLQTGGGAFYMHILVNLFLSFTFNTDLLSDKQLLIIILPSFPAVKIFQILKIIPLKNNRSCFCKRFT